MRLSATVVAVVINKGIISPTQNHSCADEHAVHRWHKHNCLVENFGKICFKICGSVESLVPTSLWHYPVSGDYLCAHHHDKWKHKHNDYTAYILNDFKKKNWVHKLKFILAFLWSTHGKKYTYSLKYIQRFTLLIRCSIRFYNMNNEAKAY